LTRRLVAALSVGAFFVSVLLGFLGADRQHRALVSAAAQHARGAAASMAERAAPLLARRDVMRLSVLAAVAQDHLEACLGGESHADQPSARVWVLDRDGRVVIDTGLADAGRRLPLRSRGGPVQLRAGERGALETSAPILVGGGQVGEVRLSGEPGTARAAFDWSWFGLAMLSCLTLIAAAAMIGHSWSTRVRGATDALIRLAAGEVGGASEDASDRDLHDLGFAMRELEKGMNDGLKRVGAAYIDMALRVVSGLEDRQLVPPGHGERTARLAARLADRLQLLEADRDDLNLACRLVDFGKASVRPSILQKQGRLTELESSSLEHHPVHAAEQLQCIPSLGRIAKLLRHQRERYDGRGAPDGLRGDRIPLGARVLAITAAFDLLVTTGARPKSWEVALSELEAAKGEVFDPWLVELFVDEIRRAPPQRDREVMIVAGSATPWRMVESEPDDEAVAEDDEELELLLDDEPAPKERS
jgi:HD-GYP domain-containing protein (c-di-GMP phosphodiesterase class II)